MCSAPGSVLKWKINWKLKKKCTIVTLWFRVNKQQHEYKSVLSQYSICIHLKKNHFSFSRIFSFTFLRFVNCYQSLFNVINEIQPKNFEIVCAFIPEALLDFNSVSKQNYTLYISRHGLVFFKKMRTRVTFYFSKDLRVCHKQGIKKCPVVPFCS